VTTPADLPPNFRPKAGPQKGTEGAKMAGLVLRFLRLFVARLLAVKVTLTARLLQPGGGLRGRVTFLRPVCNTAATQS
jgi:hypothetical protein